MNKPKLVLIGNGMAGAKLLEELMISCPDQYDISVFGDEPYGNYNRIMLSPLLAGEKTLEEIMIFDRQWYKDNNIALYAGAEKFITRIDRLKKTVITSDGSTTPYDRLVIATGSKPFILPVPGTNLDGVMSFRDIADVDNMIIAANTYKKAVVIGAGLLGLEAAMGLSGRGMDVTVIHNNEIPLNRQLDQEAGELLKQELSSKGLTFKMSAVTEQLVGDESGHVKKLVLKDGSEIETDLVIMAIGIRPNFKLAKKAGVHCERGIMVSDTLQTYDPTIYALGECIQHRGDTFGMVAPLYDQARVLANQLSEHGVAIFKTLPTATKLKVTGVNLFSVGNFLGDDECNNICYRDKSRGIYKKIVIKDSKVQGVVLYGDTQDGGFYNELMDNKIDITDMRPYLLFGKALCEEQLKNSVAA
ncbi:MAG: NAD(P)H-nitrite reductase large subunit [Bermanella sp.]|jgi:NAD(P)H-nitrite reductase large subunit